MRLLRIFLLPAILLVAVATAHAGVNDVLPRPKVVTEGKGEVVAPKVRVRYVSAVKGAKNQEEAYRLRITRWAATIEAVTEHGVWNARQTLAQLTGEDGTLPRCTIVDWPSFRIRGFMQDVGRSYIPLDELKQEIDNLSKFKVNVFHWHLTENQAWRLEIKAYPRLTAAESMTRQPGRYYTQEEARELVAFCRERQVMLIPEIDMPGHSAAFERAMCFGMQTPEGKAALKVILDEVCEVFDVPYIHLGTDEVGFTDPTFVPEMVAHVRSHGKKVISWNPGWKYAPGEVDMTQLWSYRGQAQPGIPAIDCRLHYINHFDTFGDVVALYTSTICRAEEGSDDIAGSIVALWNDRPLPDDRQRLLQNNFYPAAIALAARAWQGGGYQYYDDFGTCLPVDPQHPATADFSDFERRMLYQKEHLLPAETPFAYVRQADVLWHISEVYPNGGNLQQAFAPEEALTVKDPYALLSSLPSTEARGNGVYFRHTWGPGTVTGYFKDPQPNSTVYAWRRVWSDSPRLARIWFETQNYSRTERDQAPPQGAWDWRGSRIWLNGVTLIPPVWIGDTGAVNWETPFGNENCTGRDPLRVQLKEGWNWILIKLPVGEFTTPEVRLVKWMFTCAIID
ncbi:MAG: family 20 glycosylhydrolase [Bacteroidales bacterium]|nr:family 20 glycosylhydrolase [Bacteroidales bacterium]